MIREARASDLPAMRDIEVAAGEAFRLLGMDAVADDPPPELQTLAAYQQEGRAWVASDAGDEPVAYLLVDVVNSFAHIAQVSVHPLESRKALGRQLIDTAASWARARGLKGMTLTTFANVPWNAPYYARLGFRTVPESEWPDGMGQMVLEEAAHGLDDWPRVVMKLEFPAK